MCTEFHMYTTVSLYCRCCTIKLKSLQNPQAHDMNDAVRHIVLLVHVGARLEAQVMQGRASVWQLQVYSVTNTRKLCEVDSL